MHFITGKQLPRRTFLRGVGATVALPFMDAMVSAGGTRASAAATDRIRLVCIEEVHGLAGCNEWGVLTYAVVLLPIALPLLIYILAPRSSERILSVMRRWLDRYGYLVAIAVFLAIGTYLLIRGFGRL